TIVSYHRFHASFHPQKPRSLGQLILGDDHYGDWTGHFRAWMEPGSGRRIMLLRYEDLVAASERVLQQIAGFIGYSGQMRGWVNPFGRLHEQCPDFYRQGNVSWSPTPDWTPAIEALFILFHSALMRELGYLAATPEKGGETLQSEFDASYVK